MNDTLTAWLTAAPAREVKLYPTFDGRVWARAMSDGYPVAYCVGADVAEALSELARLIAGAP